METKEKIAEQKETLRIEAFSDGVFAIAITLLVLELIEIPHPKDGVGLIAGYAAYWKTFLAFTVGFVTILICWINHHHMFTYIYKSDSRFVWVNGLLLFVVTFTPFPTAILADFIGKENNTAVAMFGLAYFFMSCVYTAVWTYALNHDFLNNTEDEGFFRCIQLTYFYCAIFTFIVFFICFLSFPAAIGLYMLMFGIFAFPKEFARRLYKWRSKTYMKNSV